MAMSRTHDLLPRKRKADDAASSSFSNNWRYEVFLSFRGEDTRKNFTGHLYQALKDAGINAFIDENELSRGENITEEVVRAIQGSRMSVIVFSRRYADSSWCLDELVKIMECRRTLGQKVFPVFYDVDPSHVRKPTGSFAEAFNHKHKERDGDMVQRWIDALTAAANLAGWDLKSTADGNEAKVIKIIIEEISRHLNNTNIRVAKYEVGIDSRIQGIITYLGVGTSNDVRIVGIWGMGGIGKTTVAKALYNKFCHSFEASSFLANVRETIEKSGEASLQQSLLSDITKTIRTEVGHVDRGINVIKNRLGSRRVFIVLDDVDKVEQLETLAIDRDSFGPGSRIIITTRDEQVLNELGVDIIYPARGMNEREALELFSLYAFNSRYPDEGYLELSRGVVNCCGGLPLALKVLGSFLVKRSKAFWKSATEKLEKDPRREVHEKLKISYDGLNDDTERGILLDISCFFFGKDMNYVKQVLRGSDSILDVLMQRCLVTVDHEENTVMMHDLLRQMCTEIIRAKWRDNPGKWSRVWRDEDAIEVLRNESGSKKIQGLSLSLFGEDKMSKFRTEAFAKMKRLRSLILHHVELTGNYKCFPNTLRWLYWYGFPLEFIPREFRLGEAVVIELESSNLKFVWEVSGVLPMLKVLNLSDSSDLQQLPDFSYLPNLEELILKGCDSLSEVPESIGRLTSLSLVNLEGCQMLKELPSSFYKIKSIVTLVLDYCDSFEKLGEDIGDMTSLETLRAKNTAIVKLPSSIVRLKNLRCVSLGDGFDEASVPKILLPRILPGQNPLNPLISISYRRFDDACLPNLLLPLSFQGLSSLVQLDMRRASLTNFPTDLGTLSSLLSLHLSNISFQCLPPCLSGLSKLENLVLDSCKLTDDAMIHMELGSLSSLIWLCLEKNSFGTLPSLHGLSKLQTLRLDKCRNLHAMPDLPKSLRKLSAEHCSALVTMPDFSEMTNLIKMSLINCVRLVELPGLHRSLRSSMMNIEMNRCISLTPAFKESILQAWNFIGPGGIFLPARSKVFKLLTWVNEGGRVSFQVPQIRDCSVIAFTLCFTCYDNPFTSTDEVLTENCNVLLVTNHTKCISFKAASLLWLIRSYLGSPTHYLWLGHFPNYKFNLEGGDFVEIAIGATYLEFGVKKIGVSLIWDTEEADYRATGGTDWIDRSFSSHPYVGSSSGSAMHMG